MFFKDKDGCKVLTTKSDVWSASTTMMHVLEGKYRDKKQTDEVHMYICKIAMLTMCVCVWIRTCICAYMCTCVSVCVWVSKWTSE